MEGDLVLRFETANKRQISIHALRMEGDLPPRCVHRRAHISIHALRMEGDPELHNLAFRQMISIHALRMEGDWPLAKPVLPGQISIHALRMEGDPRNTSNNLYCEISIHALRMEGDGGSVVRPIHHQYFYPRPPHGGRRVGLRQCMLCHSISIHALRMEGDPAGRKMPGMRKISIHALRMEGDCMFLLLFLRCMIFLSTPSAWRATIPAHIRRYTHRYFYPRPPYGGRRSTPSLAHRANCISIHALRMEGDACRFCGGTRITEFLSTPSVWRATMALV